MSEKPVVKNIVTEILDDVEALIKDLETGYKSPRTIKEGAQRLLKCVRGVSKDIQDGVMEIRVNKTYWIFWNHDDVSIAVGSDIADALNNIGYGGGAAAAIDYYTFQPTGKQMANAAPMIPAGLKNKAFFLEYYYKGLKEYFNNLKESVPEKDFVHALEDYFMAYVDDLVLRTAYPEEHAAFMEIHKGFVRSLNPVTHHGKMYYDKFFERSADGALHEKLEMYLPEPDNEE